MMEKTAQSATTSGPTSQQKITEAPQEFISTTRNKVAAEQKSSCGQKIFDVDHLVRTSRAIIATNKEIWTRCEPSRCTDTANMKFKRITIDTVEVETGLANMTSFTGPVSLSSKNFGALPSLPVALAKIFVLEKHSDGAFPDYSAFLEKVPLLHEDIIVPFLGKLQKHLEDIQVFLGNIDGWLIRANTQVAFINEAFGLKLEMPDEADMPKPYTCDGAFCRKVHPSNSLCTRCCRAFHTHQLGGTHRCQFGGPYGSFMTVDTSVRSLKVKKTSGEYKEKFQINQDAGQKKLTKFLDFLAA